MPAFSLAGDRVSNSAEKVAEFCKFISKNIKFKGVLRRSRGAIARGKTLFLEGAIAIFPLNR
jgi:hypothetical protein